jgi:C4-dicarboxylate-specific signal transduction histidine kinase
MRKKLELETLEERRQSLRLILMYKDEEAVLILSCPTIWDGQALCVVSFVFFDWVDG